MKPLATNKKALFDYEILERYEGGIELKGFEVKAVKKGLAGLKGAYVRVKNEKEAYLINAYIAPYQVANIPSTYDPTRSRKLLLHKKELRALLGKTSQKGLTLVSLSLYLKNNRVKLEFGLGRGKKKVDKREQIKKREVERRMRRYL